MAERRASFARAGEVIPPAALGTPPPPPETPDPFMDALVYRLLGMVPPEENLDPNVLQGVSGAPGTYTGTARVVRSLAEAMDLEEGEVMVCEMTLPPWVPLFSIAGAVVSDVGGVLSHCAIVAREFDLPAVVGSQVGHDGDQDRPDDHRRRHQGRRLPRRPRSLTEPTEPVRSHPPRSCACAR